MARGELMVNVDGRRLRVTHLDKVVYPASGTTKAELIDYATRIAPVLLPHVADRPVTRKRWPHGVGTSTDPHESFFAKQLEPGAPAWIPTRSIRHSDGAKAYPLICEPAALAWLTQSASLELHVPQWRFDADGLPSHPDRLVLDLDPGPGADLAQCAAVATIARDLLTGMSLRTYPLTSGSTGIHLYAHLDGRQSSDQVSAVAHALALAIETDHPDLAVSTMSKAQRIGKVFIDWSQNNGKKTTIAPYSLRGTTQPTVAAPRTWAELADPQLRQLAFWEVLERVPRDGDLLAGLDGPATTATPAPTRDRVTGASPVAAAPPEAAATVAGVRTSRPELDARLGFVPPMLAVSATVDIARAAAERALGHRPWVEVKWDGIRALGVWERGALRLWARSGVDITDRYPELTTPGVVRFAADQAVLDGEIVALDAAGRPSFTRLQNRMHLTKPAQIAHEVKRTPVSWFLFDALHADRPLTAEALHERRTALERIGSGAGPAITVPPVFDDVDAALDAALTLQLEGVVVKDPRSPYRAGVRADSWLKVKLTHTQDVVIGGVRPGSGSRAGSLASLLVGVWNDNGTLHYAGRVGSGFSAAEQARLLTLLAPLGTHETPFADVPAADVADAVWVRPELVGEVEFAQWSPNSHLRHAVWRGLRADVPAHAVRRETP